ncbi:MAG TPA: carbohydrate-binding family 9-like protein [Tepidisphaeraceae bacterium]|jgi:hypothetical protein
MNIISILILLATTSPSLPTYTATRTVSPITIDGILDEQNWKQAPWTTDFINILGSSHPAPLHRTRCKVLWDDATLYIAAELQDTDIRALMRKRNDPLWQENCFEIFIDPDGDGQNYWEIGVNALNTTYDLQMPKPYDQGGKPAPGRHLPNLKTAVQVTGTLNDPKARDQKWTIEVAIPFADLGITPRAGETWRINFARMLYPTPRDPQYASWSAMGEINFHIPSNFGHVTFAR